MKTESDHITETVQRLETKVRRLRIAAYLVWPLLLVASTVSVMMTNRMDEAAARVFLRWFEERLIVVAIIGFIILALWFVVRTFSDFKGRRSRFVLNPGSKRS